MRTPDGQDCGLYYEDFHRGRNVQECRATKDEKSAPWTPKDCARCPVPKILLANSSPYLTLSIRISRGVLGLGQKVEASAFCERHSQPIENPYVGCTACNAERPGLSLFAQALEDLDD